jgi:hypothetical protein
MISKRFAGILLQLSSPRSSNARYTIFGWLEIKIAFRLQPPVDAGRRILNVVSVLRHCQMGMEFVDVLRFKNSNLRLV